MKSEVAKFNIRYSVFDIHHSKLTASQIHAKVQLIIGIKFFLTYFVIFSKTPYIRLIMSHTEKTITSSNPQSKQRIILEPKTGLFALTKGKKFTKKDIKRDFPNDKDRDSIVIRRSAGLCM